MIVWSTAEYVARNAVQPCEPLWLILQLPRLDKRELGPKHTREWRYRAVSASARRSAGSNVSGPIGPITVCRTVPSRPMSTDVG